MAHVLFVDDDPVVLARNKAALEAAGHTVTSASTPVGALQAVGQEHIDVIVMEALLGGRLAGLDLARTLARRYPDVPRLMLTRLDDYLTPDERADQDRDGWLPVHRYLQKPVMPAVLVSEVEHLAAEAAEAAA